MSVLKNYENMSLALKVFRFSSPFSAGETDNRGMQSDDPLNFNIEKIEPDENSHFK